MPAPAAIQDLVARFERNRDAYRSGHYNEAQLRKEFLDPFFRALGWDVDNVQGYAEAYKDVVHEDAIQIGGAHKAPDYSFRIGGARKFFVEAKKPAVDIAADVSPAFQLRRYAWSAKLPLSILTDFEEFAVYDTRVKPAKTDKASAARVLFLTYTDYSARWDEIAAVFSRDAILKGSFDRYAESTRRKAGTAEVDHAFLDEIESWRNDLARVIALRNPGLTQRDLNFVVQATIDRIIFLRICEDRAIEPYGRLQALLNGDRVYPRLFQLFQRADERYNSGLFHFAPEPGRPEPPDTLSPALDIDDKVLKDIIRRLYYPESPYEFSVLPADILGQVYEQFLGKVIRLTAGHRAVVEEKPEVRKAGGVYYTPTYIVDYIVAHTLGPLLGVPLNVGGDSVPRASVGGDSVPRVTVGGDSVPRDPDPSTVADRGAETPRLQLLNPKQAARLRILDPACGSGSFLLGAYQYLLDWHLRYYSAHDPAKLAARRNPPIYQAAGGEWRLTTNERKRILLNNLYGVDIDPQAVEVTKLSLLLKVLEGASREILDRQFELFHDRALPDLASNIKCGNSLIGPDFYQGQQLALFDDEERLRINVFDWTAEFPDVMKAGGFDAVIGNPPYIRVRLFRELFPEQVGYLESRYRCATHVWDIYLLFFERAVQLGRRGGLISFIVPIQTLHQPNCRSLRQLLLVETALRSVTDLSRLRVFQNAIVKNCILTCEVGPRSQGSIAIRKPSSPEQLREAPQRRWPQEAVMRNPGFSLKLDLLSPKQTLCQKLKALSWELAELCYVTFGLRSCAKERGKGGKDRLITLDPASSNAKPYLEGRDIARYCLSPTGRFIRYVPEEMYSPRSPALFEARKIISQTMLSKMRIVATLDEEGFYVEQSLLCVVPHGVVNTKAAPASVPLEFILGVMNSRLESFYFSTHIIDYSLGGGLVHATPGSQGRLIIPRVSCEDMVPLVPHVHRMLHLHEELSCSKTAHEQTALQRQIAAMDKEIDRLVYELYGLSDEEIRIVEEATPR